MVVGEGEFCYRTWLALQIQQRQAKNPAFSLRAFAKNVGISPSHLSNIIAHKRPLTNKMIDLLSRRLRLEPEIQAVLKMSLKGDPQGFAKNNLQSYKSISAKSFSLISKWYFFAILGLSAVPQNRVSADWISSRLKIGKKEAKDALGVLFRLGYIKRRKPHGFCLASKPIITSNSMADQTIENFQRQIMDLAIGSLNNDPVSVRFFGFRGIALDPHYLPEIKNEIREFQDHLTRMINSKWQGNNPTVFSLSTQLFPIDSGEPPHE